MSLIFISISIVFLQNNISLSLSILCSCAFYCFGTNYGQIFYFFGRVQRQLQAWWFFEVKEAARERRKGLLPLIEATGLPSQPSACLVLGSSTWWCGPRPRLGWVEMAVGVPEGPSYLGHSPVIFSLCCPLNDRRRAAHSIFKIGRLFSLSLLSCPTLALLRLLILLLLLMSSNVHPNPGPIFLCSVCAANVTWRGKSVQCCTCSK